MTKPQLSVCFATLCMLAGPALATPVQPAPASQPAAPAQVTKAPVRTPASSAELEQYAARERVAEKVATFEGGRGRGIEAGSLVVILLLVIIIILIV